MHTSYVMRFACVSEASAIMRVSSPHTYLSVCKYDEIICKLTFVRPREVLHLRWHVDSPCQATEYFVKLRMHACGNTTRQVKCIIHEQQ